MKLSPFLQLFLYIYIYIYTFGALQRIYLIQLENNIILARSWVGGATAGRIITRFLHRDPGTTGLSPIADEEERDSDFLRATVLPVAKAMRFCSFLLPARSTTLSRRCGTFVIDGSSLSERSSPANQTAALSLSLSLSLFHSPPFSVASRFFLLLPTPSPLDDRTPSHPTAADLAF